MELKTALENIQRVLEKYPEEEIETIRKNKDAAIDSLISIIKYPTENPGSREEKEVVVAMFLLSEFEEKSAFEYLLKYLSFSDNDVYYWLGDILTESFHIILANTMRRSDIDELKKTIEDPAIAEIERIMGVNTLVALCGYDMLSYPELCGYVERLIEKFGNNMDFITNIAAMCDVLCSEKMYSAIEKAFDDGIIDPIMMDKDYFERNANINSGVNVIKSDRSYDKELGKIESIKDWVWFEQDGENSFRSFEENQRESRGNFTDSMIIKDEPVFSLRDALAACSLDALEVIGSTYEVDIDAEDSRAESVDAIFKNITDWDEFTGVLLQPSENGVSLFKRCYLSQDGINIDKIPDDIFELLSAGLLFSFCHNDKIRVVMPDEIKSLYKKYIDGGYDKKGEDIRLVAEYAEAAANLYGVILKERFLELFKDYSGSKMSDEYIDELLKLGRSKLESYELEDGFIISNLLYEDNQIKKSLLMDIASNSDKMYIPHKKEFLKYSDPLYFDMNSGARQMSAFFRKAYPEIDADLTRYLTWEAHNICMGNSAYINIFDLLDEMDIGPYDAETLRSYEDAIQIMRLYTRRWENKAFTDRELQAKNNKQEKKVKIGRNDPCPCGSGKKYKKCCGK